MLVRANQDFTAAVVLICLVQTGALLFGATRRLAAVLDKTHYKGSAESLPPIAEKLLWAYLVVGIVGLISPTNVQWWLLVAGVGLIVLHAACHIVSRSRILVPLDLNCDKE